MNKEQIEKRVLEIKTENEKINNTLAVLEQERQKLINAAVQNNGRILELESLLKSETWPQKDTQPKQG